jgi:tetratricopeptide (TPR) repeat protein
LNIPSTVSTAKHTFETGKAQNFRSIRVSPKNYFAALFLTTIFSGFLFYIEKDWAGAALFLSGWLSIPVLAWSDRITYDGKRLIRTGFAPRLWGWINNFRYSLKISAIEQIETRALRPQKRGGNIFYRFQTTVQGRGVSITFTSLEKEYRQMAQAVFQSLPESMLDNCSLELRDYGAAPKNVLLKAARAKIPSVKVLEKSQNESRNQNKRSRLKNEIGQISSAQTEEAENLRQIANELRLAGYFLPSLEAFGRALYLTPENAWLLYDFARCLHSLAAFEKNQKLARKAFAAMRLTEKRGSNDARILARLGESYFEVGDLPRARILFEKSIELAGDNFRSIRGLAEIALRQGKIAYVIHHFSSANRIAETAALKRWTKNEVEYFSKLSTDEEYMDLEINRVNLLENFEEIQKTCLLIIFSGFPLIIFGVALDEILPANLGWAISLTALSVWVITLLSHSLLAERMPPKDED